MFIQWAHVPEGFFLVSGDHGHAAVMSAGARNKRPLLIAFLLTLTYMFVEAGAGLITGSLALLSDAGHMLTDVVGLGMAIAAVQFAQSKRSRSHTYGLYRLEVLAALANALLLFGVAAFVLFEAYRRISDPPDVAGGPVIIVAVIGLCVNLISFSLLRRGAGESLNVRGAYLEVMSDALGSLGVIISGIILITTGWEYADAIIGAAIGLFILPRTYRLAQGALRILLEVAPSEIDVDLVELKLRGIPGVEEVHDLHVWTLTSGLEAATAHVTITNSDSLGFVLDAARDVFENDFNVHHVTLQCEPAGAAQPHEALV